MARTEAAAISAHFASPLTTQRLGTVMPVLYVRSCTGVLGDSVTSLTVPAKALYTQDDMPGVVVVREGYQFFVPVNVIEKRDGMVYISEIQAGALYEGDTVRLF